MSLLPALGFAKLGRTGYLSCEAVLAVDLESLPLRIPASSEEDSGVVSAYEADNSRRSQPNSVLCMSLTSVLLFLLSSPHAPIGVTGRASAGDRISDLAVIRF